MAAARTLRVRLSEPEWLAFASVHRFEFESEDQLAARWVVERLGRLVDVFKAPAWPTAEEAADPRERLRKRYRPSDVWAMFVVERETDGTFFYAGDSALFTALKEACERVHGSLPDGPAFLAWFRSQSFWLWSVPAGTGTPRRGRPRKDAADDRTLRLARQLRELWPDTVYAIGTTLEPVVRRAADLAGIRKGDLFVLPSHQGPSRTRFVEELAAALAVHYPGDERDRDRPRLSLDEAMVAILAHAGDPLSSRAIANEIARRDLYRRADGRHPPASQVSARARRYPGTFVSSGAGISLVEGA